MLVTDGAVDTYDAIFAKYNWPERKVVYQNTQAHTSYYSANMFQDSRGNSSQFPIILWSQLHEHVTMYIMCLMRSGERWTNALMWL